MKELFLTVLNLSAAATVIGAALLFLRVFLKRRLPRRVVYLAWALMFVRLLFPVTPASQLSIFNLLNPPLVQSGGGVALSFVEDTGGTISFPALAPAKSLPDMDATISLSDALPRVVPSRINPIVICATIWLCGVALLVGYGILCYVVTLRRIRRERVVIELPLADALARELGLRRPVRVCQSELFDSPIVCGLSRCSVLLPMTIDLDNETLMRGILAHELTHIRRGDNFWRMCATLITYLHWFNPLVWVAYRCFMTDMEVSCDENVLRLSKSDVRGDYAQSLLSMVQMQKSALYGGFLAFGESAITERVKQIMRFRKSTVIASLIGVAILLGLSIAFLTNPAPRPDPKPLPASLPVLTVESGSPTTENGVPDSSSGPGSEPSSEPEASSVPQPQAPPVESQPPARAALPVTAPKATESELGLPQKETVDSVWLYLPEFRDQVCVLDDWAVEELYKVLGGLRDSKSKSGPSSIANLDDASAVAEFRTGAGGCTRFYLGLDRVVEEKRSAYSAGVPDVHMGGNVKELLPAVEAIADRQTPVRAPFHISSNDISRIAVFRYASQTYADIHRADQLSRITGLLNTVRATAGGQLGAPLDGLDDMVIYRADGTRIAYSLFANGVRVTRTQDSLNAPQTQDYQLAAEDYAQLVSLLRERFAEASGNPSWLGIMSFEKAGKITVTDYGTLSARTLQRDDARFSKVFNMARNIVVEPDSYEPVTVDTRVAHPIGVQIEFLNGIVYDLYLNEESIVIQSSDMDYGTRYQMTVSGYTCYDFADIANEPEEPEDGSSSK